MLPNLVLTQITDTNPILATIQNLFHLTRIYCASNCRRNLLFPVENNQQVGVFHFQEHDPEEVAI